MFCVCVFVFRLYCVPLLKTIFRPFLFFFLGGYLVYFGFLGFYQATTKNVRLPRDRIQDTWHVRLVVVLVTFWPCYFLFSLLRKVVCSQSLRLPVQVYMFLYFVPTLMRGVLVCISTSMQLYSTLLILRTLDVNVQCHSF